METKTYQTDRKTYFILYSDNCNEIEVEVELHEFTDYTLRVSKYGEEDFILTWEHALFPRDVISRIQQEKIEMENSHGN